MRKKILIMAVAVLCLCVLCSCGAKKTDTQALRTSRVTKKTEGAIKAEQTNVIKLHDAEITLPKEYRYAISEEEDLNTYFVFNPTRCNQIADANDGRGEGEYETLLKEMWENARAEALKKVRGDESKLSEDLKGEFVFDKDDYITAYHENISMIVYEGIDRASPNSKLSNSEVNQSLYAYYNDSLASLSANLSVRNTYKEQAVPYSDKDLKDATTLTDWQKDLYNQSANGDYYVFTIRTYSGDYMNTTYGLPVFPHTYYCIYFVEKECFNGSMRRWYGFAFSNDSKGNIFAKEDFDDLMEQIKKQFGLDLFPTEVADKTAINYDAEKDTRTGINYEQLSSVFDGTFQYHTMYENQSVNIDELSEEEVAEDDTITEIKFD